MTLTAPNDPTRILVADSPDLIKAMTEVQNAGEPCKFAAVGDGVEAMHTLLGASYDLVVIDLAMTKLDGLRLIALIHATPELRHLPILAIASPQQPASTLEAMRAGGNDYLPRPIEWPQLTMRIRQLTGRG